ncbi:hypothetical protein MLD38_009877 [Melastoma candidum]|uniref:Uncharacterized protein n=1 Tax=Melastoma candidum TaxID=119954 RepID=A0ACB9RZH0_9MYRT|nr:hypothetical protein MLD38_009877 [Melastoma candidum]
MTSSSCSCTGTFPFWLVLPPPSDDAATGDLVLEADKENRWKEGEREGAEKKGTMVGGDREEDLEGLVGCRKEGFWVVLREAIVAARRRVLFEEFKASKLSVEGELNYRPTELTASRTCSSPE